MLGPLVAHVVAPGASLCSERSPPTSSKRECGWLLCPPLGRALGGPATVISALLEKLEIFVLCLPLVLIDFSCSDARR